MPEIRRACSSLRNRTNDRCRYPSPTCSCNIKARQDAAKVYDAGLNQIEDVVVPEVAPDRSHVYHLYTIRHPRRDEW